MAPGLLLQTAGKWEKVPVHADSDNRLSTNPLRPLRTLAKAAIADPGNQPTKKAITLTMLNTKTPRNCALMAAMLAIPVVSFAEIGRAHV